MASGTLTTSYRGWTYRIYWSSTTNVNTNTSTVLCDHWLVMDAAYSISIGTRSNSCTVGTDTKAFTSPAISAKGTTVALGTTSHTVQHNADGAKTVSLSSSFNVNATLGGVKQNTWTITATLTLDTIPRASAVSLSAYSTEMGNSVTISVNRASTNFKHTIYYHWYAYTNGQARWVAIAENVTTQTTWTVPLTFANNLPGTTTGWGTIYCETYNGSTYIGTTSAAFEATVPASVKPSLTMTATETTGHASKYGALVQGKSKLSIAITGIPAYNSPITAYRSTVDGMEYYGATAETQPVISTGTITASAQVTDERGRQSDPVSYSFEVLPYSPPTIPSLAVHRCDQDGTENDQGEYIKATFSASVSPLDSQNTAKYTLKYTEHTDSGAVTTTEELTGLGGTYSLTDHDLAPFVADGSSTYTVEILVEDDFSEVSRATSASTAFTLMNWGPEGNNMAIGKVAEKPHSLEVALDHIQTGNSYVLSTNGGSTSAGWVRVANIVVAEQGADSPISFVVARRNERAPMTLNLCLQASTSGTSMVETFEYEGQKYSTQLFMNTDDLTYDLYVQKANGDDIITVQDWWMAGEMRGKVKVIFPGDLVEEPPSDYMTFEPTPAKLRSFIDVAHPVNSLYFSFTHENPADIFPGTTWTRIAGRFLFGADAGEAIGQTGGEETHTLTVDEMPSHRHELIRPKWYGNDGTGNYSKVSSAGEYSILAELSTTSPSYYTTDDNTIKDVQYKGGGAAHNNMPPYITVSIWRRTA